MHRGHTAPWALGVQGLRWASHETVECFCGLERGGNLYRWFFLLSFAKQAEDFP